jgi:hypothetical protein
MKKITLPPFELKLGNTEYKLRVCSETCSLVTSVGGFELSVPVRLDKAKELSEWLKNAAKIVGEFQ